MIKAVNTCGRTDIEVSGNGAQILRDLIAILSDFRDSEDLLPLMAMACIVVMEKGGKADDILESLNQFEKEREEEMKS